MGTKGTCKTSIAEGLLSYLELYVEGEEVEEGVELMIDEAEDSKVIKRFSVSSSPGMMGGGIDVSGRVISGQGLRFYYFIVRIEVHERRTTTKTAEVLIIIIIIIIIIINEQV